MTTAVANLQRAFRAAENLCPRVGGFPYLAETLRRAGVHRNEWVLPSLQRIYITEAGSVVEQGAPLLDGLADIAPFDTEALIRALRADQEGRTSFDEFVAAAWAAGVVRWVVELDVRTCTYYGADGDTYVENYSAVSVEV